MVRECGKERTKVKASYFPTARLLSETFVVVVFFLEHTHTLALTHNRMHIVLFGSVLLFLFIHFSFLQLFPETLVLSRRACILTSSSVSRGSQTHNKM